jgi:hypothetical protein
MRFAGKASQTKEICIALRKRTAKRVQQHAASRRALRGPRGGPPWNPGIPSGNYRMGKRVRLKKVASHCGSMLPPGELSEGQGAAPLGTPVSLRE